MAETLTYRRAQEAHPVVAELIDVLEALPERDRARSSFDSRYAVHALAEESGFYHIKTPEEKAVASAMEDIFCGPRSAHYGWRLYACYRQCGQLNPLNITY